MNLIKEKLKQLFDRIPRRYNPDNVKEMYSILDEYEDILTEIETEPTYEKEVAVFFDELAPIRDMVKNSSLNKHSKQAKDKLFDEAYGASKDTMEALIKIYK